MIIKSKYFLLTYLLFDLLFICQSSFSQSNDLTKPINKIWNLEIVITSETEIKKEFLKYFKKEITKIGGINLTDENVDYKINIVVLEVPIQAKTRGEAIDKIYFVSIVITRKIKESLFNQIVTDTTENSTFKNIRERIKRSILEAETILSHQARMGSYNDIQTFCKEIMIDMNTNIFRRKR